MARLDSPRYTRRMLQLSSAFTNKPIMSLRTGTPIARVTAPLVNPNNLKIEGFFCEDIFNKDTLILLCQDIRDFLPQGFVVNDHEVLAEPDELVRLKELIELSFNILGKPVETVSKEKIGKVSDYATDESSMYIQKLYVSQSLLKSFMGGSLSVDRTQIHEITPRRVIINEILKPSRSTAPAAA
jgi:sporulation protein YlmC with PRC-barrel domain